MVKDSMYKKKIKKIRMQIKISKKKKQEFCIIEIKIYLTYKNWSI
jgi:hypothetical protein